MIDYLYQTSDFNLFLILSLLLISLSVFALLFIKKYMPLHLRYQENAVIGCTSALVILIYGIIAGFATSYLINTNTAANDAILRETNGLANLYHDSQGLSEPLQTHIQTDIKHYISQVLTVEWPLMIRGKSVTSEADILIKNIVNEITHSKINNPTEALTLADILTVSRLIYDAREQRIQLSYSSLSAEVWVVILLGTLLTLCVSYLFGVNFNLHIFIVIAAALMTSSIIFLLISLDKPFQGEFIVGPEPYLSIAAYLDSTTK